LRFALTKRARPREAGGGVSKEDDGPRWPASVRGLRNRTDHEAHVREAGERRRLEHALHDDGLHVLVDLEHHDAGEVLARVELLPDLALALQDVEQLVDA